MQIYLNAQMNAVILFIIGIPLVEIYLLIKVGGIIGALNTIFLIFFNNWFVSDLSNQSQFMTRCCQIELFLMLVVVMMMVIILMLMMMIVLGGL